MTSHRKKKPVDPDVPEGQGTLFDVEPLRVPLPEPVGADSWLTTDQLASLLNVRARLVQEQAANHRWPAHMVGKRWRFSPADVALIEDILRRAR
jgi:excisionase family DNA binding protein